MEFHWPDYQYMGPGTHVKNRLARGDPGISRLDRIAKAHDMEYDKARNLQDKWVGDRKMIAKIDQLPGRKTLMERIVRYIMKANSSWACKIVLDPLCFKQKRHVVMYTGLMFVFIYKYWSTCSNALPRMVCTVSSSSGSDSAQSSGNHGKGKGRARCSSNHCHR